MAVACLLLVSIAVGCGDRGPTRGILAEEGQPLTPETPDPRVHVEPVGTLPPFVTEPIKGTRVVSFLGPDETRLFGRLFGDDGNRSHGVLLLHSSSSDMRVWFSYAEKLMADGYMVFAFDFRGYAQSSGERKPSQYPKDVEGGLDVLQLFGADRVAIVGSEVGGTAAVAMPERWSALVRGIVTIGSDATFEELDVREVAADVREKTLVLGEGNSELAELIPDAAEEVVSIGDIPERDARITSKISDFIGEVVGEP